MNTADPRKHSDAGSAEKSSHTGRVSNAPSQFSLPNRRNFLFTATASFTADSIGFASPEGVQTGGASGQVPSSITADAQTKENPAAKPAAAQYSLDKLCRDFVLVV